jgi:tRNA dimethylallyltransferase
MSAAIRCIAIMGATATGKSALAVSIAEAWGGEIVSMDSRQVYRGFDVGTGKVPRAERARVPHHLIDVAEPEETWSAGRHAALAASVAREIAARGRVPILVGGTGLYFRALFRGLVDATIPRTEQTRIRAGFAGVPTAELFQRLAAIDPARAKELSRNDRVRITRALELFAFTGVPPSELYAEQATAGDEFVYLKLVLFLTRPLARERIAERTRELFEAGWPEEVRRLLERGVTADVPAMNSLGYRAIAHALKEGKDPASCLEAVVQETRRYAKRQETFFRSERDACWIDASRSGWERDAMARVEAHLRDARSRSAPQ